MGEDVTSAFINPFARKSRVGYPEAVRRLKDQVRSHLKLAGDVSISVTELNCSDPDCPDSETIIALLGDGKPRLARIHKLLPEVTLEDVAEAFSRKI